MRLINSAIAALKEAIKQQGEPVAYGDRLGTPYQATYCIPSTGVPEWMRCMTPLYTSAPSIPEGWLTVCSEEMQRGKLTSNPLKFEFAKSRGMKDLEEVHSWMAKTRRNFTEMVEKAMLSAAPKGDKP